MIRRSSLALLALASACARAPAPEAVASSSSSAAPSAPPPSPPLSTAGRDRPGARRGAASASAAAAAPEAPLEGLDFIDEARVLFRVAACGPTGDVPPRFDAAVVEPPLRGAGARVRRVQEGLGRRREALPRDAAPEGPARHASCTPSAAAIW